MARDLKQYLRQPDKLFRRVRDEHGILHLSKAAKAYHPGAGVYRSSYKNAFRLARTEVNIAYRTADHVRWQQLDFVVGVEIHLSNNHTLNGVPFTDICDDLKGKYPKDFKFVGWHPQCRCFATSVLKTPDELEADNERIMNGDEPTAESVNTIKDMPENFKGWIDKNADRIAAAEKRGTLPYFIKDNKGYVAKVNPTVLKSDNTIVARESNAPNNIVDIVKNISDNMTDKELTDLFVEFCNKNPDLFNGKLNDVHITKLNEYMSMEREYRLGAGDYIKDRGQTLNITNVTEQITKFNPYVELKNALLKIKNGGELTFKEEYALECSWHEIKHAGAKGWKDIANKNIRPKTGLSKKDVMETVNQFVARNTYDGFITSLGGKAVNKEAILARGYGYRTEVENFNKMLDFLKIDKTKAAAKLDEIVTKSHYEDVWKETAEWIKTETGVDSININRWFNHLKDSDYKFGKELLKISK